jgi:uncharacterized protein
LMVEEEKILLNKIIEDEILLTLPAFPKHQHACSVQKTDDNSVELLVNDGQSSPKNPFSVLAKLKHTGDL